LAALWVDLFARPLTVGCGDSGNVAAGTDGLRGKQGGEWRSR